MKMKFSIIIPTLNSSSYIYRCLKSIQDQTYKNFEVIVVDAGSRDDTKKIVDSFGEEYFFYELIGSNQGQARNFGVQKSTGELINFLDSDEFYLSNCLQEHLNFFLNNTDFVAHYCNVYHYRTGNTKKFGLKKESFQPKTLPDFIDGYSHNLTGMSIRKSLYDMGIAFEEDANGRFGEEGWLQFQIAARGFQFDYQTTPVGFCEMRVDSHTQWEIQHKLKEKRISDINKMNAELGNNLNYCGAENIDLSLFKLMISYILIGNYNKALYSAKIINNVIHKFILINIIYILRLFPKYWIKKLIIMCWLYRQNKSFTWGKLDSVTNSQFVKLNP